MDNMFEYCKKQVESAECTCGMTPQGCHYLWCNKEVAWQRAEDKYEELYDEPLDGLFDCLG